LPASNGMSTSRPVDGYLISGIQQIGIGVPNLDNELQWCIRAFGTDVLIFDDEAEARLMVPYTGGEAHSRHAKLVASMCGGGGLELWQFTKRRPAPAPFPVLPGDLGICCVRMKSRDPRRTWKEMNDRRLPGVGPLTDEPEGEPTFFVRDPLGLLFQVTPAQDWFARGASPTGAVAGCMIGVSRMEVSLRFYSDVLGYDTVVSDREETFENRDPGVTAGRCRRVVVARSQPARGAFSPLLGSSRIELVEARDRRPRKIFAGRYWGDIGFIHVCFDVRGMDALRKKCADAGFPFTVDSAGSFRMGEAAGRFAYIEDPDGTLIEFVETYRLNLARRIGLHLDLQRRPFEKPLPRLLLRALALNRIRPGRARGA